MMKTMKLSHTKSRLDLLKSFTYRKDKMPPPQTPPPQPPHLLGSPASPNTSSVMSNEILLEGIKSQINKRNSINLSLYNSNNQLGNSSELNKSSGSTASSSSSFFVSPPSSPKVEASSKRRSIHLPSLLGSSSGSGSEREYDDNSSGSSKKKEKEKEKEKKEKRDSYNAAAAAGSGGLLLKSMDLQNARRNLKSVIITNKQVIVKSNDESGGISMESPEKKGNLYVLKQNCQYQSYSTNPENWNQYWCILREGLIYIYQNQNELKELDIVILDKGIVREKDSKDNCFQLIVNNGTLTRYFCTYPNEEFEYFSWIVSIRGSIYFLRSLNTSSQSIVSLQKSTSAPTNSHNKKPIPTPIKPLKSSNNSVEPPPSTSTSNQSPLSLSSNSIPPPPTIIVTSDPPRSPSASPLTSSLVVTPPHTTTTSQSTSPPPLDESVEFAGSKKGNLQVASGKLISKLKNRWVVLNQETLSVYKSQEHEQKKQVYKSFSIIFCSAKVIKSTNDKYTFSVVSNNNKSIHFSCPNGSLMLGWITSIQEAQSIAMEAYLQYQVVSSQSNNRSSTSMSSSSSSSSSSGNVEDQVTESLDKSKEMLSRLRNMEENRYCADCGASDPLWASINIGVFICINCSGIHRSMGVHISKVRSCTMDIWDSNVIDYFQQEMGNERANKYWEYQLPQNSEFKKLTPSDPVEYRDRFIRAKYDLKLFIKQ